MKSVIYKMTCLTNMHVGNGDINFSVIDNEVEKDVLTGYPTIHSSGVKGALREYLSPILGNEEDVMYFGSKPNGTSKERNGSVPGCLKFLSAHLLARPMRVSNGNVPYALVTTKEILDDAEKLITELCGEGVFDSNNIKTVNNSDEDFAAPKLEIEGYTTTILNRNDNKVLNLFALENVYIMNSEDFKNVDLPVLARNCLENGKSVNLWYEEIVPYKSIFFFCVIENVKDVKVKKESEIITNFTDRINNNLIQFGGNASIGYGLTKVEKVGNLK